jgi:uncharacterized membrane protein YbhN (UPF0104 family)
MKEQFKQKLIYILKAGIGLFLVIWILSRVDRQRFLHYFTSISISGFLEILLFSWLSLLIQFRCWKFLVESNSIHFEMKDLIPSFFSGFTFRLLLPGGHAEFGKIFLLPGRKRGKAIAFGMEKFFQGIIKIFLMVMVIPISFPQYSMYAIIIIILLILVFIFFPKIPYLRDLQEKKVNNYKVFVITMLYSLSVFSIMSIQYYILLNQVNTISLVATFHAVIYLFGSGVIPISISGLGVREGLAVYFLKMYGIPAAHAVATSLFLFTINTVTPALLGIYFIYKKRSHLKEIKSTVLSTRTILRNIRNGR